MIKMTVYIYIYISIYIDTYTYIYIYSTLNIFILNILDSMVMVFHL